MQHPAIGIGDEEADADLGERFGQTVQHRPRRPHQRAVGVKVTDEGWI
ncbi:hypothetical protein [Actinomadura sp. DC4]|nr:hypothetical protein [Actinomadura sp. DC4]MDN3358130.1 hypothetical protein [Actinomadura sp. DC4]